MNFSGDDPPSFDVRDYLLMISARSSKIGSTRRVWGQGRGKEQS